MHKKLTREWWLEAESNCRHADFQSAALPTELSGLNPTTEKRIIIIYKPILK